MNLLSLVLFFHLLGISKLDIISNLPSTSFNLSRQILHDLKRLPFYSNENLHKQPMGVGDSVGQLYNGLHDPKKGLINYMERDPRQGGSSGSTSPKGSGNKVSGNKELIPFNKSGSIVQPKSGSGNRGLAPSNPAPSNPVARVPTVPEPRKSLSLRQFIANSQASGQSTQPSPSSSTQASGQLTYPGPSSSAGKSAPATTNMEGSGQNSPVMIPGTAGELVPGKYVETPDG